MLVTITVNLPRDFCLRLSKDRGLPYPLREVDARVLVRRAIEAGLGLPIQQSTEETARDTEAFDRE